MRRWNSLRRGIRRHWPKGHPELRKQCLEWTGYCDKYGYGQVKIEGRMQAVHRLAAELAGWKIAGKDVHHICENKCCFEIEHLELLGRSEHRRLHNKSGGFVLLWADPEFRKKMSRQRRRRGENHPQFGKKHGSGWWRKKQ